MWSCSVFELTTRIAGMMSSFHLRDDAIPAAVVGPPTFALDATKSKDEGI